MKKQAQNIFTVVMLALAAFAFFYVLSIVLGAAFSILKFIAPALLIGALVVNHKVVLKFGNFLVHKLTTSPLAGIAYIAGTFFLFPLVCAGLLVAAFGSKKLESIFDSPGMEAFGQQAQAEETEFEIIDEDVDVVIVDDEPEILLLPEEEVVKPKPKSSKYEDLF